MQNGTIIVLAWPEGMVKNADSWYDFFSVKKRNVQSWALSNYFN